MKKQFIIILFALSFFLTGCTSQDYNVVINEDGTSTVSLKIYTSKNQLQKLQDFDIKISDEIEQDSSSNDPISKCNPLFQESATQFFGYGFDIEPINDNVSEGFIATKKYKSPKEFNEDFKKLNSDEILDTSLNFEYSSSLFGNKYHLYGTLSYTIDPDVLEDIQSSDDIKEFGLDNCYAKLSVTMPGNISNSNTDVKNGIAEYKAECDISQSGKNDTKVDISSSTTNTVLLVGCGLGVLIIIGIGYIFVGRKMKEANWKKKKIYEDD